MSVASLVWQKAISGAPLLPTGKAGNALRYAVIKATRRAPLKMAIAKGDTVVQVGATGRGEIWEMARLAGPNGRLIVVECAPENLEAIYERIERDDIHNMTVIPKGAWSERSTQTLYVHPRFKGSHIVLDSGAEHDRVLPRDDYAAAIEIEVDTLDRLLAAYGITHCDFMKITVMGAEMQVLRGMPQLLKTTPKLWVKAHALVDGKPANVAISTLLQRYGYRTVVTVGNEGPDGRPRPGDVYGARL
jgi:FkbM family methyltransferase